MNSHGKKLKDFLNKSDEDLLMIIEKEFDSPDSHLARAVLQNNLNKSIVELKKTMEDSNKTNTHISIVLAFLTMILAVTAVLQLFNLTDLKFWRIWCLGVLFLSSAMMVLILFEMVIPFITEFIKRRKK